MSHKMADRYLVHRTELVVNLTQLGQIFRHRVVQLQQAPVAKLHYRNTCERLCVRRPVVNGVSIDRLFFLEVCRAEMLFDDDLSILQKYKAAAHYTGFLAFATEDGRESGVFICGFLCRHYG